MAYSFSNKHAKAFGFIMGMHGIDI